MNKFIYQWDIHTNEYGYVSYTIPNKDTTYSTYKALVSQSPIDESVLDSGCWSGSVCSYKGDLISTPPFVELDEALLCSEIIINLDSEYVRYWTAGVFSELGILILLYRIYMINNPDTPLKGLLLNNVDKFRNIMTSSK